MTDPASTALAAPRLSLGDGTAAYDAAVERARDRGLGDPPVRPRRDAVDDRSARSARRSPSGSAGSMRRRTSPTGPSASRRSATPSSRRVSRPRSSPAWAAAASPRTSSTGRSARSRATSRCASSTRPTRRTCRPRSTTSTRSGRSSSSRPSRARRPSRTPSWPTPGTVPSRRSKAVPHHSYDSVGAYFAAITDPDSVRHIEHANEFREVFLNPPDIGGRYSALTYVGLVPASLIGIDLDALLASGLSDARRLPRPGPGDQPGAVARPRHRRRWPRAGATS